MKNLLSFSATEITTKLRNRELTAIEVASFFIKRVKEVNPLVNAINQFHEEKVLQDAEKADKVARTKNSLPILHGLPITIKDAFYVKDFICSKGCPVFAKTKSNFDATIIRRLKNAGAIILGITNTPELLIAYETDNKLYGRTNNPHDLSKTPGGSSGGEAAIIACGGSPVGIGTDAGGSIRQPAHFCGICGHKPTNTLVPMSGDIPFDGEAGLISQLLTAGPMSRYAVDLKLILNVISGPDYKDPHSYGNLNKSADLIGYRNFRIAYFYNIADVTADEDTIAVIDSVIHILKERGFSASMSYPDILDSIYKLHWETFMFGGDGDKSIKLFLQKVQHTDISMFLQAFIEDSADCNFSITELRDRLVLVEQFRYKMLEFMKDFDILISPVAPTPAVEHGQAHRNRKSFIYTTTHNLTGWPATVVPCGTSKNGLPINIQIAAKPHMDYLTISMAQYLQELIGVPSIPSCYKKTQDF